MRSKKRVCTPGSRTSRQVTWRSSQPGGLPKLTRSCRLRISHKKYPRNRQRGERSASHEPCLASADGEHIGWYWRQVRYVFRATKMLGAALLERNCELLNYFRGCVFGSLNDPQTGAERHGKRPSRSNGQFSAVTHVCLPSRAITRARH